MVKLEETSAELGNVILNHKVNITNFEEGVEVVLTEIASQKDNIFKRLNELELKLQNETHTTKKKITLKMNDEATEMSSQKSTVDNWKNIFKACILHSSNLQVLVKLEEISSRMPKIKKEIAKVVHGIKAVSISIKPEEINQNSLGCLKVEERSINIGKGLKKVNFHSGSVNVLVTIDVDVNKGGYRYLSGVFIEDNIILTDRANLRILRCDHNGLTKEEFRIASKPIDVVGMSDNKKAVASDSSKIHILNINPFTLIRTLDVKAPVWGLCYVEGEFITANSSTITWLNSETGVKIKGHGTNIDTKFVTSYEKDEYIYMNNSNSVCFKSSKGRGFEYINNQLFNAYCQDIDYDGNIYTTGYTSKNIHQLTSTGELVRIIPTSDIDPKITDCPWVLRFQPNRNKFLLTFHSTGKVLICDID